MSDIGRLCLDEHLLDQKRITAFCTRIFSKNKQQKQLPNRKLVCKFWQKELKLIYCTNIWIFLQIDIFVYTNPMDLVCTYIFGNVY